MFRLALIAVLALTACADAACPQFERCDIRQQSCQERILSATKCMRGGSAHLPKVTVIDTDELNARFRDEVTQDKEELKQYGLWNDGLALFALAPANYTVDQEIADEVEQIAAVYFDNTKDIVVVDRGVPLSDENAVTTLTHEIVHALQDDDYDLHAFKKRWVTDFDSGLALDGLIEGEAVTYQLLASAELAEVSPNAVDWENLYTRVRGDQLKEADLAPAVVSSADVYFPYAFGGGFVTQHWLARGREGIDQLFEKPPLTTREILFGPTHGVANERRALDAHALPVLPDAFESVGETSYGAWIARMFVARLGFADTTAWQIAGSVVADRFSVFADADGAVIAAWRLRRQGDLSAPWPGDGRGMLEGGAADAHEAYLIAAEAMLPAPADQIAWQAATPADQPDDGMQSAAASHASALRHVACNRPWRFRE